MKYFVYILQSEQAERFYIGVTSDLEERVYKHNQSWTKSTKPYVPWKIIYTEEYSDKSEAYKREYFLKSAKGFLEKKRIIGDNRF